MMVAADRRPDALAPAKEKGGKTSAVRAVHKPVKPSPVPPKDRKMSAGKKVLGIAALAAGFVLALALVTRFAALADYSSRIGALRAELKAARQETSRLEMELTNAQNLSLVMAEASDKLSMGIPTEAQLRKVHVEIPEAGPEGEPDKNWPDLSADRLKDAWEIVLDWLQ